MKVVILCGGKGARMKEVTDDMPKPLAMIGGKPILWHIMKLYEYYGFNEFILLLGYKGDKIKEYFMDYRWKNHDFILDNNTGKIHLLQQPENWKITFIDTGLNTMTGSRIKKVQNYIEDETFMLTYGDGVGNVNIKNLLKFHREKGRSATVTGIVKKSQYGTLTVKNDIAESFQEKSEINGIINGGFFVLNKKVFQYLRDDDNCIFEQAPLMNLAKNNELAVYPHQGMWMAMDTYKDLLVANEIFEEDKKSWRVW
ncbi:MAG: sugar phosphate nucleotidyltransferase [Marinisporobacter sp.]|nr:sugar phosphate nucleotidyltransferase [Marinisporobacter sp.]